MPPCQRQHGYFKCRDCREDFAQQPDIFWGRVEICKLCIASWICELQDLERVYLIVPGLPRAQIGDEDLVYRWGEPATIQAAINSLPEPPLFHELLDDDSVLPVTGTGPAITLRSKSANCCICFS